MDSSNALATFDALKREILKLGFTRPGSLVRRFMPCGKFSCRCTSGPTHWHGPYYQWSYKVGGKTRTMRLTKEQAGLCEEWTRNHKRLRMLVRQIERISLKETNRSLAAICRL